MKQTIKHYFFVDTNIIIGFRENQYKELDLNSFINDPKNCFFYTETVLNELQTSSNQYPEADPGSGIAF